MIEVNLSLNILSILIVDNTMGLDMKVILSIFLCHLFEKQINYLLKNFVTDVIFITAITRRFANELCV